MLQNGYAPLHLTAPLGNTHMATLLLNNAANANCRAKNGLTPMHLCAQEDKVNVAEILEKHGAEIDPQTKACISDIFHVSLSDPFTQSFRYFAFVKFADVYQFLKALNALIL